ncbi:MAG: hypothetical protein M3273_00650, partial [Actinomycetota bacterium]|nr:hypothetical protein [Actinomycetota bacterium]
FGLSIRAVPAGGSGLLAWLLPAAAVAGGIGLAVVLARRWTRRPSEETVAPLAVSEEMRTRLSADLERLRSES